MDVKNCRGCGRLFNYIGGGYFLCPACMEALDKKFQVVKKYIQDNPKATMTEISQDMMFQSTRLRDGLERKDLHLQMILL